MAKLNVGKPLLKKIMHLYGNCDTVCQKHTLCPSIMRSSVKYVDLLCALPGVGRRHRGLFLRMFVGNVPSSCSNALLIWDENTVTM